MNVMEAELFMPRYEKTTDLDNELATVKTFGVAMGYGYAKKQGMISYDFDLFKGDDVAAYAEVKVRSNKHDKYPTTMIRQSKVDAANDRLLKTGLQTFLIVQWKDLLGWCVMTGEWKVEKAGRYDRNDRNDLGLHAFIPLEAFGFITATK